MKISRFVPVAVLAAAALILTGCVAGEDAPAKSTAQTLTIDFATYNPLSLIIKERGLLEEALPDTQITWVQSAGSNKANEGLRAGALDIGSTAGSAALLNRTNGSEIRAIGIANNPEWSALIVGADSPIQDVASLRGKKIAATTGTDPYFFLLQALESEGLTAADVTIENLQHADGWAALQSGSVDAWAGLDPIMGSALESGARFLYRNNTFNSFDVLAATETFLTEQPQTAQTVLDVYEKAREWARANPAETAAILARIGGIDESVATQVISERTNFDVDPVPGAAQREVLNTITPVLADAADIRDTDRISRALDELLTPLGTRP